MPGEMIKAASRDGDASVVVTYSSEGRLWENG
jgi:hypothetical protein